MTTESITYLILGILGGAGTLYGIYTKIQNKKSTRFQEVEEDASLNAYIKNELKHIRANTDDIKNKQQKMEDKEENRYVEVMCNITRVEESAKSAHKRIDEIIKKGCGANNE